MITVTDLDRNGKPLDLSKVKIKIADFPAIAEALLKEKKTA